MQAGAHPASAPLEHAQLTGLASVLAGKCAVTFSQDQYQHSLEHRPHVRGHVGTALTPGSPYVLDRASATLQPCTPQLCALGSVSNRTQRLLNYAPLYTAYPSRYATSPAASLEAQMAMAAFWRFVGMHWPQAHQRDLVRSALGLDDDKDDAAAAPASNATSTGGSTIAAEGGNAGVSAAAASPGPYASGSRAGSRHSEQAAAAFEGSGREPIINPQQLVAAGYDLEDTLSYLRQVRLVVAGAFPCGIDLP
jgi:hypothetical protein